MERLFIRWVRHPEDLPISRFWEGWVEKHPFMADTVAEAKELVKRASAWDANGMTRSEELALLKRIRDSIALVEHEEPEVLATKLKNKWIMGLGILLVAVVLVVWWVVSRPEKSPVLTSKIKSDSLSAYIIKRDSTFQNKY